MFDFYKPHDKDLLSNCTVCPRECGANRFDGGDGYCRTDAGLNISSICIHRGEEPAISGPAGICNIFFSGCNLGCIYCQNHEISRKASGYRSQAENFEGVIDTIESIILKGIKSVGFVSPSHMIPQVRAIIEGIWERGLKPVTVFNTSSYDKVETLKNLAGYIDVYLPDLKYVTPEISAQYSDASDYPEVALNAVKEMYYQKGSTLITDENGVAESGILLRHLVLPGHVNDSISILRILADEVSTGIHISLMSQYHPTNNVRNHNVLNRPLYREEYESVVTEMDNLGFRNGWVQDMDSFENYRPNFSKENPFE
jgi:putative pyruvate formate lyase activating enzyme